MPILPADNFKPAQVRSGTFQVMLADSVVQLDGTAAAVTATLPTAASAKGKVFRFIRTDSVIANAATVKGAGAELINGANTLALSTQYKAYALYSNGTLWLILSSN